MARKDSAARRATEGGVKPKPKPGQPRPVAVTAESADKILQAAGVTEPCQMLIRHHLENGTGELKREGAKITFKFLDGARVEAAPKPKAKAKAD